MSEERDDSSQLIGWGGDLLAGLAAAQMAIHQKLLCSGLDSTAP